MPPPLARGRRPRPRKVIDFFALAEAGGGGRRRLKISDVAEYLGVTEDHVRQLIAYGHLTAVNVGGTGKENRYRIAEKELYAFVERSRNEPKSRRGGTATRPRLSRQFRQAADRRSGTGQVNSLQITILQRVIPAVATVSLTPPPDQTSLPPTQCTHEPSDPGGLRGTAECPCALLNSRSWSRRRCHRLSLVPPGGETLGGKGRREPLRFGCARALACSPRPCLTVSSSWP